ncbi:hypothetical protein EYF80_036847 [Liparis tanakae]|uniref:Uncharacterized protein n=1 Tax=Liparis tanakae TaxID=230148 RepID=A0A4Z2GJR7_9TELE|nr:hypothetical protein EYF80_036847 [Liparis tanakae]
MKSRHATLKICLSTSCRTSQHTHQLRRRLNDASGLAVSEPIDRQWSETRSPVCTSGEPQCGLSCRNEIKRSADSLED